MSMSVFAVKTEEGRKGQDGQPSVGPVYRNPLAKDGFPPLDPGLSTTWDIFRYDKVPTLLTFAVIISCTTTTGGTTCYSLALHLHDIVF